ncbi:MAG: hypothetical protein ACRYF4_06895 [Janthinobacterium lividum]
MADYIYLLETRLSPAQQRAIGVIRGIARENELTVFLTGGAVRDLTGGGSVRDLDLTVQGEVSKLKAPLQQAGAELYGENAAAQQLFLVMQGGVRVELSSAMSVSYPQPGKPTFQPATLSEDLRTRDFTANAMAISLNEGSYGLLMDPLNGVADIENRELRLVSNYGFIEDPSRLIRAARLSSRLGWQMEERTRQRYDTAKEEGYISALADWNRGYELEEIFHEEDPVRILRALEAEGWMETLFPALTSAKANTAALNDLAERQGQLQTQGILAQSAALAFPLVAAKLSATELAALKQALVRPGFVDEINSLETRTRDFATRFASKEASSPSAAWKLLHSTEPNLVLSMSYGSKTPSVQSRLKTFLTDSPTARQRIPYVQMQEMRILSDLEGYGELVEKVFFELMDGKLSTPEELKAFLEPYSPPAPPPPVNLRRARAKKEARPSRAKSKKAVAAEATVAEEEEAAGVATGLMEVDTLTGPDRGAEPSPDVPLEGKVAPEPTTIKARVKKSGAEAAAAKTDEQPRQVIVVTAPAKTKALQSSAAKKTASETPAQKVVVVPPTAAAKKTPAAVESKPAPKAPAKQVIEVAAPVVKPVSRPPSKAVDAKKPAGSGKVAPAKAVDSEKVEASAAKKVAAKTAEPAGKPASAKPAPTTEAAKAVPVKTVAAKKAPSKKTVPRR